MADKALTGRGIRIKKDIRHYHLNIRDDHGNYIGISILHKDIDKVIDAFNEIKTDCWDGCTALELPDL